MASLMWAHAAIWRVVVPWKPCLANNSMATRMICRRRSGEETRLGFTAIVSRHLLITDFMTAVKSLHPPKFRLFRIGRMSGSLRFEQERLRRGPGDLLAYRCTHSSMAGPRGANDPGLHLTGLESPRFFISSMLGGESWQLHRLPVHRVPFFCRINQLKLSMLISPWAADRRSRER